MVYFYTDPSFDPPKRYDPDVMRKTMRQGQMPDMEVCGLVNDLVLLKNTMDVDGYDFIPDEGSVTGPDENRCEYFEARCGAIATRLSELGHSIDKVMDDIEMGHIRYNEHFDTPPVPVEPVEPPSPGPVPMEPNYGPPLPDYDMNF